ncbi:MAG: AMIN domain-containing protein, partial [Terriglobales bacterium]
MRESLNNLPTAQQSRHEYQRVIAAYRRVYYGSPASSKADPSVVAVAELLTAMGRRFDDNSVLRSAVGQYKFLRREYPGSRDRIDALFTMGQIYQDDLKDQIQAKQVLAEFLHRYPHHHLASEARKALAEAVQQAGLRSKDADDSDDDSSAPKARSGKANSGKSPASAAAETPAPEDADRKVAHVTGIRHWSNPNYTRVAIGLERDIKFDAQRIDNPERIFFDLRDTNLTSALLGKTFEVDDGLLKKIRVAQFQPGTARIVLEVEDRSDYTTFLLTDPPRLIIDVHSKDIHPATQARNGQAKSVGNKEDGPATYSPDRKSADEKSPHEPVEASRPVAVAEAKSTARDSARKPAT